MNHEPFISFHGVQASPFLQTCSAALGQPPSQEYSTLGGVFATLPPMYIGGDAVMVLMVNLTAMLRPNIGIVSFG